MLNRVHIYVAAADADVCLDEYLPYDTCVVHIFIHLGMPHLFVHMGMAHACLA